MRTLMNVRERSLGKLFRGGLGLLVLPLAISVFSADLSAQLLDPLQVFEQGVACPADQDPTANFVCTSNDIKLDLVELSDIVTCQEGQIATATFDIDLQVNANVRYNPMVWISENGIDPRLTGASCFVSSVPDGPITHIPELLFADVNDCADIDVPSNNFLLEDLSLGSVDFLCVDTDGDGMAEIPIIVTWNNSGGQACEQGTYPINQTPSKCDAFIAETDIEVVANPGVELVKTGAFDDGGDGVANPGEIINYNFSVENTGDTPLTNVTLSDPGITVSGGPIPVLGVGETDTTTFTGTYAVTQADIDFGSFTNTATVDTDEGVDDMSMWIEPLPQAPDVLLLKTGTLNDDDGTPGVSAGDTISYTFSVENTGNVTLTTLVVTDPLITVVGGPLATLAVGATDTTTFTGSYVITQADIDFGSFTNVATVTSDQGATDDDDDTQILAQDPAVVLLKTGVLNDDDGTPGVSAGDTISYTFSVENTGNVTLTNLVVTDPLITVVGGPLATLAVGATDTTTFTGSYVITQADIDAGSFTNIATVTSDQGATDDDDDTQMLAQNPAVVLIKTGTVDDGGDGVVNEGDTINYTFSVENTGNVTLTNLVVTDPLITVVGGPLASLAVGATDTTTFTGTYVITQADIDSGSFTNTATVTSDEGATDDDSDTQEFAAVPMVELLKTGTVDDGGNGVVDAGDTINYTFSVENTGNVTLTNLVVTDPLITVVGGPLASLAPDAIDTTTFTGTYVITQADIDSGSFTNTATVTSDEGATDDDSDTQEFEQMPMVELLKTGTIDDGGDGRVDAGDTINYTFSVENTGNVTLTNLVVTDPVITVVGGPLASLDPGAIDTTTFTGTYVITQADIDAGSFTNTASVTSDEGATDDDDDVQEIAHVPAMTLVKSSPTDEIDGPGTVTYNYLVTNTGNVTLTGIYLEDDNDEDDAVCLDSELAPGESTTCTATHDVTEDEVTAFGSPVPGSGELVNNATVFGSSPGEEDNVSASDSLAIPFKPPAARFLVTKDFTDDNAAVVQAYIVCDTGLPLEQDSDIFDGEGGHVNFVVGDFVPGTMDCVITEDGVPEGYTGSYVAGLGPDGQAEDYFGGDEGCFFENVVGGQFTCEITNTANPATYTVVKNWTIHLEGGDLVFPVADVTITCDRAITDGVEVEEGVWELSDDLGDGDTLVAQVDVTTGPATCSASEEIPDSSVESSSDGCGEMPLSAGESHVCTFTNTVFFEGIPTMNQYGLALLALLMLGIGAVGLRRFV